MKVEKVILVTVDEPADQLKFLDRFNVPWLSPCPRQTSRTFIVPVEMEQELIAFNSGRDHKVNPEHRPFKDNKDDREIGVGC